jgi:hypothetical protein
MHFWIRIGLLSFFVFHSFSANAKDLQRLLGGTFTSEDFASCLAQQMAEKYAPTQASAVFDEIKQRRQTEAEKANTTDACLDISRGICGLVGLSNQDTIVSFVRPLGCHLNKWLTKSLLYHSSALIKCQDLPKGTSFFSQLGEWQVHYPNHDRDLNHLSNEQILSEINSLTGPTSEGYATQGTFNDNQINCILALSDPLDRWLLQQPFESVSQWGLFKKANEIYKDPLVALAVIGQIFDSERMACPSRKKACVLGNKMKPMYSKEQTKYWNPVGENYHFWAQLNISLTENATQERLADYMLEWKKDEDNGEYSANSTGIDIGHFLKENLTTTKSQSFKCNL